MTVFTHAALPVLIATVIDGRHVRRTGRRLLSGWQMLGIGVGGVLPDLLNPHLMLDARHGSWTHTAWFLAGVAAAGVALVRWAPRRLAPCVAIGCGAVVLHVLCDGISGGVRLFPPCESVTGDYFIPPRLWFHVDFVVLLAAYLAHWDVRRVVWRRARQKDACA
jgi:membrane-bound metal-dependent hydrolase YbcI (DUF457 family)